MARQLYVAEVTRRVCFTLPENHDPKKYKQYALEAVEADYESNGSEGENVKIKVEHIAHPGGIPPVWVNSLPYCFDLTKEEIEEGEVEQYVCASYVDEVENVAVFEE